MIPNSYYRDAYNLVAQCSANQDQQGFQILDHLPKKINDLPTVLSLVLLRAVHDVQEHFFMATIDGSGQDPFEKAPLIEYIVKGINHKYGQDCLMNLPQLRYHEHISKFIADLAKRLFENSLYTKSYHFSTDLQTSLIRLLNNSGFDPNAPVYDAYEQYDDVPFGVNFLSYVVGLSFSSDQYGNKNKELHKLINELQLNGAVFDPRVLCDDERLRSKQLSPFIKGSQSLYEKHKLLILSNIDGDSSFSMLPSEVVELISYNILEVAIK
jgi:hypothetical protein